MKLLLINSSGRINGNTARVMNIFEDALFAYAKTHHIDLAIERVNLARLNLKPCIGCRACFDRGEDACPCKDDLLTLRDQLLLADGFVIASPVYVEDVNGIMKTMIDRLAFQSHRPALYGKTALLFTTSGTASSNHAINTMRRAFGTWGIKVFRGMKFRLGALSAQRDIQATYGTAIARAAGSLMNELQKKPFRPSFFSLLAFTVQQAYWRNVKEEQESYDSKFWRESGWLDRNRRYYDASMARSFQAIAGRALGKMIALFFA